MYDLFNWLFDFIRDGANIFSYLFSPFFSIGEYSFSPVTLISFYGLSAYLVIAVVKWGIS